MADWRKDADRRYKEKQKSGRYKLSTGDNSIRILPRKRKDGNLGGAPFLEYMSHPGVGPNERFMRCGKNLQGEGDCWLCDMVEKLKGSSDRSKRARALRMEPREQFATQIAYLDEDQNWHGPVLWAVPSGGRKSMSAQLLGVLRSTKRDFVSLTKGYNLNIDRQGTGKTDTRYGAIIPDADPTVVPKSVIDKMKTLAELVPQYDADAQEAAYYGKDQDDDEPKSKSRGGSYDDVDEDDDRPKKKRSRDDDDDDDDDDDAETGQDEEDDEPKAKKKKVRVDDDDSDDAPDVDDDDEVPVRKKKKSTDDDDDENVGDVDDDDEEVKPKSKKKRPVVDDDDEEEVRPKSKKSNKRPVDDDDEPEQDSDDEEDKPKSKKKKPAVDDEDDDAVAKEFSDVYDSDGDEPDEPPKKKKASAAEPVKKKKR